MNNLKDTDLKDYRSDLDRKIARGRRNNRILDFVIFLILIALGFLFVGGY